MNIPVQLQNPEFRFIKLRPKEKIPIETDWTNTKNYPYNSEELSSHVEKGGNFGIVGGKGNLRIIDIDRKELAEELLKNIDWMTFTVKTGSGGVHFYFISDYNTNHVLANGVGEVRVDRYQVVCPGCVHPNGNTYDVLRDVSIKRIDSKSFTELFKKYMTPITNSPTTSVTDNSRSAVEFGEVCRIIKKGFSKEKVFYHMKAFEKWNNAPTQYKELTYKKALTYTQIKPKELDIYTWKQDSKNEEWFKSGICPKKCANELQRIHTFKTIGEEKEEILYYQEGVYLSGGHQIISSFIEERSEITVKSFQVTETIAAIKRRTYTDRQVFENTKPQLICVKNGVINTITQELLPHDPQYNLTQKINHTFDKTKNCELIKSFMKDILTEEDILIVQEFLGFVLYRKYFIKKSMIFVGPPDTGKTTLINLMVNFIHNNNCSGASLHKLLYDKFTANTLHNKLMNFFDDLSFKDIKETGMFKIVCGGGYISAEKKFGESYQFMNYAKLLFATNKISSVEDSNDDAYYSRWLIIFFNNTFAIDNPKRDPNILDKLSTDEQMSGLLNFALDGLQRLFDNKKFSYKHSAEQNKNLMEYSSNTISAFALDCLQEQPGNWVTKGDLYQIYCAYVNHFGGCVETKDKFGKSLPKKVTWLNGEAQRIVEGKKQERVWVNVGLKNTDSIDSFLKLILLNKLIQYNNNTYIFYNKHKVNKDVIEVIKKDNQSTLTEEIVNHHCYLCNLTPCIGFNTKGKPVCEFCQKSFEAQYL